MFKKNTRRRSSLLTIIKMITRSLNREEEEEEAIEVEEIFNTKTNSKTKGQEAVVEVTVEVEVKPIKMIQIMMIITMQIVKISLKKEDKRKKCLKALLIKKRTTDLKTNKNKKELGVERWTLPKETIKKLISIQVLLRITQETKKISTK